MATLYCLFDILWVMVAAPDNDQILDTTGNEQFSIMEYAEIGGAKKWAFVCSREVGLEGLPRLYGTVPVPLSYTWTCYPDLSYLIRSAETAALRVYNAILCSRSA